MKMLKFLSLLLVTSSMVIADECVDENDVCQIAFYEFEEDSWSSSGDILDSSGNTNHGSPVGDIEPFFDEDTHKSCQALAVPDNNSDSVIDAMDTGIDINDLGEDGTISFWYKSNENWFGGGDRQLFDASYTSGGNKYFFLVLRNNGSLRFGLEYNGDDDLYSTTSPYSFLADEWVHIAVNWDPADANMDIYINGNQVTTTDSIETPEGGLLDELGTLNIGDNNTNYAVNGSTDNSANGYFDDVRVYNYIQSQAAIEVDMDDVSTCINTATVQYHFDELIWDGTTDEVIDSSDNNLHGTAQGGLTTANSSPAISGDVGTCSYAELDGIDDYVALGNPDLLNFSGEITLAAWIRPDLSDGRRNIIVHGHTYSPKSEVIFRIRDGEYQVGSWNGVNYVATSTIPADDVGLGNWVHLAGTYDGTTWRLYRNGVEVASTTNVTGALTVAEDWAIGARGTGTERFFDGGIDEPKIYSKALTEAEILALMSETQICPTLPLDHFRIEHDTQGFTCEAESITITACVSEDCAEPYYTEPVSISLSPSGVYGGDTFTFTGQTSASISYTEQGTLTFSKSTASENAALRCFNGSDETCDLEFVDSGFEFFGANVGDVVPDQEAETNFQSVNLRAVEKDTSTGSCKAALTATTDITLGFDCISPTEDTCLTAFSGIPVTGDGSGESVGVFSLTFNSEGIAALTGLSYADAGRLQLSAESNSGGKILKGTGDVEVYPSYLKLSVAESVLLYGGSSNEDNYVAGENFTFTIGAYGKNDQLLPNYQASSPQLKVERVSPNNDGQDGTFEYTDGVTQSSSTSAIFIDTVSLTFNSGEYEHAGAYYDEVGRIEVDFQDADYLGNEITLKTTNSELDTLTLGNFYPAFFKVTANEPELEDKCGEFSYIGQEIHYVTDPQLTITAYNAQDKITRNFSSSDDNNDNLWNYSVDASNINDNLSYEDAAYTALTLDNTFNVGSNTNYDGSGVISFADPYVIYDKVDDDDNAYDPVFPFDASITFVFASNFFNSTFTNQDGGEHTICYKEAYADNTCIDLNRVV